MDIMRIPYIFDALFALIVILAVRVGHKRGAFRIIAGIFGTLAAWIAAGVYSPAFTPRTAALMEPWARRAVERAAAKMGESAMLQMQGASGAPAGASLGQTLAALGLSDRLGELAERLTVSETFHRVLTRAEGVLDPTALLTKAIVDKLAPIITFFILFLLIKLVIELAARLLSLDWPIVGRLNRLSGGLAGLLGGLLLVLVLCAAIVRFGSDEPRGLTSRELLRQSFVGGVVCEWIE